MLIVDESADVATLTGPMRCRIMRPKDTARTYPGLILWSEIFAITGPIARAAQFFAGNGFLVVIPEFYHEYVAPGVALTYTPEDTQRPTEKSAPGEAGAVEPAGGATPSVRRTCSSKNSAGGGVGVASALAPPAARE